MFEFYGNTQKSHLKDVNQDNFMVNGLLSNDRIIRGESFKADQFFAVTDGVGSSEFANIAARYILEELASNIESLNRATILNTIKNSNEFLHETYTNSALTVVSIVWINNEKMTIFHIGDTRVYLQTQRNLIQLTNDQTYVQELYDDGLISEEMKYMHPNKNIIKGSLGANSDVKIDVYNFAIEPNQKLLLSSDGIHDYIKEDEISQILKKDTSLEEVVLELFSKAKENDSKDDMTALLISYK